MNATAATANLDSAAAALEGAVYAFAERGEAATVLVAPYRAMLAARVALRLAGPSATSAWVLADAEYAEEAACRIYREATGLDLAEAV